MAFTYDLTEGSSAARTFDAEYFDNVYVKEVIFDASVQGLGTGESVGLMRIPPKHVAIKVVAEILTAEGVTNTVEVGNTEDEDAYIDALDCAAAAGTVTSSAAEPSIGVASATATILGIKAGATEAMDTAKVKITALIVNMAGKSASLI